MPINASFHKLWTKTLESKHSSTHKNDKKLQSILSFELWQGVDCNQQLLLDAVDSCDCEQKQYSCVVGTVDYNQQELRKANVAFALIQKRHRL